MRFKKTKSDRTVIDKKLLNISNRQFFLLDGLLFAFTPLLAMILRVDNLVHLKDYYGGIVVATIVFSLVKLITFSTAGFYKRYWKYASIDELIEIAALTTTAVVIEIVLLSIFQYTIGTDVELYLVPRSLPLLDGIIGFVFVGAVRFSIRAGERKNQQRKNFYKRDRVLIVGAGDAGVSIMQEMRRNLKLGLNPVAFVDDDSRKLGLNIQGITVIGNRFRIPEIVSARNIRQVVIAMPTASGKVIREIVDVCQATGIPVSTLPTTNEILDRSNRVNTLREVKIEDLLRREPIDTDAKAVSQLLTNKVVLITGAGGSIGSELCRQIFRCRPAKMILLGHGENSVFNIQQEMQQVLEILQQEESVQQFTQLVPYIADIRLKLRLEDAFKIHQPDIVFHAAAHKHVPLMEINPPEAITNNVLGTKNLLDLAIQYDVGNFVMISTDKAVNPTNVMGASKRTAEMLVLKAARTSGKPYAVVRFGNVLGSRGSVVPTFKRQIAKGGPVTITHPEICRYFMTIPEAVQLVLQAAVLTNQNSKGQIFMLNMGQPVKIVDLARDLIRLSGYELGKDIDITFTGLRPGEKLYEELLVEGEEYDKTAHEKLLVVRNASNILPPNLDTTINILLKAAEGNDINSIVYLLDRLVVGYNTKYQEIDVAAAQSSLEKIISENQELNSVKIGRQPEFIPLSDTSNLDYVTRLTPVELRRGIKRGLENEEFCLYYQPVMDLNTGDTKQFEALLRWHHPHLGLMLPQRFIAAAEESGLIVPLQRWIIEAVCMQLQKWQQDPNFDSRVGISINIPSLQIFQPSLVKHLQFNLDKYHLDPKLITWEISEYLICENPRETIAILPQLKQLGIQLQIDNFGRVASIYGHIQPNLFYQEFGCVKIDRYLINSIEKDWHAWCLFKKIVLDLKKFGLKVTTTGIENSAQLNKIAEISGDYGQGNFLSLPLNAADASKAISSQLVEKSRLN